MKNSTKKILLFQKPIKIFKNDDLHEKYDKKLKKYQILSQFQAEFIEGKEDIIQDKSKKTDFINFSEKTKSKDSTSKDMLRNFIKDPKVALLDEEARKNSEKLIEKMTKQTDDKDIGEQ